MSIIRAAIRLIIQEHAEHEFSGKVLSLGVPEAHATTGQLEDWFRQAGAPIAEDASANAELTTNEIGAKLGFVSGRSFLNFFGFDKIDCLDVPGCEHPPEITHDLNLPIAEEYHGQYRFVMDPGTLEHVFDQAACLKNIVAVLDVGGWVCHLVPTYSFNGGYYSINPNVLHDFYATNGFSIGGCYLIMWDRYRAYSSAKTLCYRYDTVLMGSRHAIGDLDQVRFTPHLLFFARKEESVASYHAPLQFGGNYAAEASFLDSTKSLRLENNGKKVARIAYNLLPFQLAFYLQSAAYRWLTFFRARRISSFKI
jgi:hypothetical protein